MEVYSHHKCVWNTLASSYKNQGMRDTTLKEIVEEMRKRDFTSTKVVANKIKHLRFTYYQESKKFKTQLNL